MIEDYNKIFIDKRDEYSNDLKGVQYVLLRLLRIVDYICKKYNLVYWLDAGTLLGAHRHNGFIPWDDDIDIAMPREEYDKFIEAFALEKIEGIFLQSKKTDENYKQDFIKIRDLKSKVIENSEVNKEINYMNGIFLDIFPLDEIKENNILRKLGKLIHKLAYLSVYMNDDSNYKIYKKLLFQISKKIKRKNILKINKYIYTYLNKNINKNGYIYMEGQEWWNIWRKDQIYPLREIIFENFHFMSPNNIDYYLKELYQSNYMIIPEKSKQYSHLNEIILNIESEKNEK